MARHAGPTQKHPRESQIGFSFREEKESTGGIIRRSPPFVSRASAVPVTGGGHFMGLSFPFPVLPDASFFSSCARDRFFLYIGFSGQAAGESRIVRWPCRWCRPWHRPNPSPFMGIGEVRIECNGDLILATASPHISYRPVLRKVVMLFRHVRIQLYRKYAPLRWPGQHALLVIGDPQVGVASSES